MLLDAGADVNLAAKENGVTPLAAAVIEGAAACVRHLLAKGADPELPDTDGFTPLMHAALHGRVDSAAALVEAGAVLGAGPAGVGAKELAHVQGHQALVELIEGGDRKRLEKAAADKAEAERVVAAKEASERAAIERAAAEKAAETRAAAEEKAAVERAAAAEAATDEQAAAELAAAAAVPPAVEAATAAPAASEAELGASANLQAGERNTGRRTRCAAPTAGQLAPTRLEVVQEGDDVVVRLHAAEIVRLRSHGELTLSSGGWRTVSTLEAINGSVAELVPVRPLPHASTPDSAPAHRCAPVPQHPPPQHTHIGLVGSAAHACKSATAPAARHPRHMRKSPACCVGRRSSWSSSSPPVALTGSSATAAAPACRLPTASLSRPMCPTRSAPPPLAASGRRRREHSPWLMRRPRTLADSPPRRRWREGAQAAVRVPATCSRFRPCR